MKNRILTGVLLGILIVGIAACKSTTTGVNPAGAAMGNENNIGAVDNSTNLNGSAMANESNTAPAAVNNNQSAETNDGGPMATGEIRDSSSGETVPVPESNPSP